MYCNYQEKLMDLRLEVKNYIIKQCLYCILSIGLTKSFVFLPNKISRSSNYHGATLSGLR